MQITKKTMALAVCTLLIVSSMVFIVQRGAAEWIEGDDYKMHFPQPPDPDGMDVWCNEYYPLADDFLCTESGPITDVHIWGSWYQNFPGTMDGFWVGIWSNNPGDPPEYPSHPEALLWEQFVTDFHEVPQEQSVQGFYVPQEAMWMPDDHVDWVQYNIDITDDPFWQEEGTIYWLSIRAVTDDIWGWKNADLVSVDYETGGSYGESYLDDAVWGTWDPTRGYNWFPTGAVEEIHEMWEPYRSADLAFVITGPPCCNKDWNYWTDWPNMWSIPIGNIGIGTSTPSYGLDIYQKSVRIHNPTGYNSLIVDIMGIQGRLGSDLGGFFFAGDTNGKEVKLLVTQGGVLSNALRLLGNSNGAVFNEGGLDRDFRIETTGTAFMFYIDAGTNNIGIGKPNPSKTLDINGDIMVSGNYYSSDGSQGWTGTFTNGDGSTVTVKNGIITGVS